MSNKKVSENQPNSFEFSKENLEKAQKEIEKYPKEDVKEKLMNPVWHIHNGQPPKEKIVMPSTFAPSFKATKEFAISRKRTDSNKNMDVKKPRLHTCQIGN